MSVLLTMEDVKISVWIQHYHLSANVIKVTTFLRTDSLVKVSSMHDLEQVSSCRRF